jgi:ABC-type multidrug transport system ATPase subunit
MSLLRFQDVSHADGRHPPVRGVDLSLEAGERLVAFGPSGSGKRTFLKLAAGILEPQSGAVTAGKPSGGGIPLGYVPVEGGLMSNMTLLENSILPLLYHGAAEKPAAVRRARELFAELGIANRADLRPAIVSHSARRLTHLARALLAEPAVFVLDEPLSDVEASAGRTIRKLLGAIGGKGSCAVLGTAVLGPYLDWGRRFIFFREGRAVPFDGPEAVRRCEDEDVRACLE